MTCVSIETFHLWRFIVSLIVDPFTPLRGCMPQKGKQGLLKGSFKEYRDKNTSPGSWRCWVWQRREVCEYFSGKFWFETLSRKTFRTPWLSPFVSITDICFFLLCEQVAASIHEIYFLFPFLQPMSFISIHHNRYYHAHAAGKDPIHPSINLFRPSCLAWDRKGHPTSTFLKSPSSSVSSVQSGQGQEGVVGILFNLEWMGHQMLIMKGMVRFQKTRKEYIPQVRQKGCWLLKISFTMDWKPSSLFVAAV